MKVGAVVRAQNPEKPFQSRAVVATVQDDETIICVLWEDEAPHRIEDGPFVITPTFSKTAETTEATVNKSKISELLDFEKATLICADPNVWKDSGDKLLKLKDPSSAASYYEAGLLHCAKLQIGTTVLIRQSGRALLAEVDCLEDDTVELTVVDSQQELCANKKDILLCVREPDTEHVQERILLNLSRCLIQLADLTTTIKRRPSYLKAAVLGCTASIEVAKFHDYSETQITAWLLRSKAQEKLCKFQHAIADIKKVLKRQPNHTEGQKRLKHLEREKTRHAQSDKKLVKDVSRWVQSVMNEEQEAVSSDDDDNDEEEEIEADQAASVSSLFSMVTIFFVVLIAWFWQKQMS